MATYDELIAALRKADAAGDVAAAREIAKQAKALKAAGMAAPAAPQSAKPPADAPMPALPTAPASPQGFTDQIAAIMAPQNPDAPVPQAWARDGVAPADPVSNLLAAMTPPPVAAPTDAPTPNLAEPITPKIPGAQPAAMDAAAKERAAMIAEMQGKLADPQTPANQRAFIERNLADLMAGQGAVASVPPAPIANGLPNVPVQKPDLSSWQGDLEAGWNTLKTILPGLRAGKAGRTIGEAVVGQQSQGGLDAEAAAYEADAAALEAEIPNLPDAESQAFAREQVTALRERAAQRRLLASTPTAAATQTRLESDAAAAVPDFVDAISTLTDINRQTAKIPMNPAAQRMSEAETFGEGLRALADDPAGVMRTFALRSLPVSAPAAIGAIAGSLAGPGGAATMAALAGGSTEMGATIADETMTALQAAGVDTSNPDQLKLWAEQNAPQFLDIVSKARTRAIAIGASDAVTGGATGALARAAQGASKARKVAATGIGGAVEAGGEGVGEAFAQAASGDEVSPGEVLAEMIGGAAIGGPTTAGQMAVEGLKKSAPIDQIAATMRPHLPPLAPTLHPPAQGGSTVAPLADQKPPQSDLQRGQTITRAEAEADPERFEIIDEAEGQGANMRPTGQQVVIDKQTGQAYPLAPEAAAVPPAAAGAPGGVDSAGKPQAADGAAPESVPAAGPATEAEVVAAGGGVAPPQPPGLPNQPRNFEFIDAQGVQGIGTEPEVMQYKAGGDADGVTDRLRGVTEWRPERAGVSIIYEYADGRRVIADGHQRLGLAKRLAVEGKPIQMPAMILREVDGVTPKEARVTAALKNIAEGSGTALDAAKILRDSPQTVQDLGLPPNSAIVRDANGMRALSDQAFGMVVNGVSSERDGGIVGRVVTDKAAQANILGLLARMQKDRPITAFQAEMVAKQAAADTVTETQDSLFGPETDTKNLYLERAKILEFASRLTRDESKAFKNVMDNADRLQAAGNQLDADGNKARLDSATAMSDYLTREANTKGAISEALTAAARALNGGAKIGAATKQFLNAVERELAARGSERPSGDSGGQAAGSNRPQESEDQGLAPTAKDDADLIGNLFGDQTAAPDPTPKPDPKADILSAMTGQKADTSQAKAIETVNRVVKPENKDGAGFYAVSGAEVQIDADGADATIRVTTYNSQFKGRAKVTSENGKTLRYSEVRASLNDQARGEIDSLIAEGQADDTPAPAPDAAIGAQIRAAFNAVPSVQIGRQNWYPITVTANGKTVNFLASQFALGTGKAKATIHLATIRKVRMTKNSAPENRFVRFRLNAKDELIDDGLPVSLADGGLLDFWAKAGFAVPDQPETATKGQPGKVGQKFAAGDQPLTTSGRKTTPFPRVDVTTNGKASNTLKRVDEWLMSNAALEAEARGDEFNARMFRANLKDPSQSDKDSAEAYLFDPDFSAQAIPPQPSILKPLTPEPTSAPAVDLFGNAIPTSQPPADAQAGMDDMFGNVPQSGKTPDQLRAEAEAKVRADQSAMRKPDGNTGDAGPLFDDQADMLDAPKADAAADLISKGRAILQRYARSGDESFDQSGQFVDLSGTDLGRNLAESLLAAKTFAAKKKAADAWALKQGKATGLEHLVVLNAEGVPLVITQGVQNAVSMPTAMFRAGSAGEAAYSVHNHPRGSGPSAVDLSTLSIWPKHTMAIVGHNGDRHEMTATDAFDRSGDTVESYPFPALPLREALSETRESANFAINSYLLERREADEAGFERFSRATNSFFQLVLDEMGLIKYADRAEWLAKFEAEGFNFEEFYGQVSGNVADRLGRAGFIIPEKGRAGGNRPAGSGAQTASPGTDGADQKPQGNAGQPDAGRVPPQPVGTGDTDFDAGLDALFGTQGGGNVSGTGNDMERGRRDGAAADGVGATNVPPAAGGLDGGAGRGGNATGGRDGQQGSGSGIPNGNAAPVGTQGNQAPDGQAGTDSQLAATGNGGRRGGGRRGRLPSDTGRENDAAANAGDQADLTKADAGLIGSLFGGPQPQAMPKPQPAKPIEDFGEKIGGARKDTWAGFQKKMDDAEGLDVASEPLSKTFPEPDYEQMLAQGVDPWTVAFVRAARETIPRKPVKGWKQANWALQVKQLRSFVNDLISGKISQDRLKEKLGADSLLAQRLLGMADLYLAVGHERSLRGLRVYRAEYSVYQGKPYKPAKVFWEVQKEQAPTAFGNMPRVVASGETREAMIEAFKAAYQSLSTAATKTEREIKLSIYSRDNRKTWIVGTKVSSAGYVDLRTGIESPEEARRIVGDEGAELQDLFKRMRDVPSERRDTNAPRIGADHRNGGNVTPAIFMDTFGFRGVEFGNYVEGPRRQEDLNNAYDGLLDMAAVLGIPPKAISLNGTLGLAFGARGSGGKNAAAAHYEPDRIVINLTKTQGKGSLAHEWFHALDNYFARQRTPKRGDYITDNLLAPSGVAGLRPETVNAFLALKKAINATKLKERSTNLDKLRSKGYWATGIELHARAFESYIIDRLTAQGYSNDYLANTVNGVSWQMQAELLMGLGDSYPYLNDAELKTVGPAFDALFKAMIVEATESGLALRETAAVFKDTLPRPLMLREDPAGQIDPQKYDALKAMFERRLAGVDLESGDRRGVFIEMMKPLVEAGVTRDQMVALKPYFDQYLADYAASRLPTKEPKPKPIEREDAAEKQAAADKISVKPVDRGNIDKTLPLLLPEQRDDVFKVETRFAKPDGHGMMLTNGTGTGKTFSGGGVIKRFVQQGKSNVLIVAPSDAVIEGWRRALGVLNVPVSQLADTKDAGQGVVITTYANLRANNALASREWDLVVTDEAQNLMSNAAGGATSFLENFRAITNRPADLGRKSDMIHAGDFARYKAMPKGAAKDEVYRKLMERREREVAAMRAKPRSKVLFLSATPFAYDKAIDYAEGYLFNYPEDGTINGSRQSGRNLFMVQNFGYRIRYHKLTKPEHAVDSAVFEREFHEKLKRDGVLSGRSLQVDVDYDRRFVKKNDADGTRLDEALELLDTLAADEREAQSALVKAGQIGTRKDMPFNALQNHMRKNFDYLARQQLLEAIKARLAVAEIKAHLALGRKVVVFHDFNVGGGLNPFTYLKTQVVGIDEATGEEIREPVSPMTAEASDGYRKLIEAHPWVADLNFAGYKPPIKHLPEALGKTVRLFNGTVPTKQRLANLAAFNTDGSGVDVLVVQADAGGAGISMHDTTQAHQRVLINLGMPTKPTTTLQQEGRILRVGSASDAPFRYFTIGTTWERVAFAQRIAERSGTVENLALGNDARDLMNAFIDAYMDAADFAPSAQDGKGGKAKDNRGHSITPFQRAVSHYFGRPKISGRRDQRDGIDFYPTAEPLAFKMVEWAGLRANERVLEPSAGDGAIARYMPDDVALTMVEPSSDLRSTAMLRAPKADVRETTFEQHHISNKYHAIVMNPPFGAGGKTAMDHLAKAARHLRPGGRIVALIPTGPSADKHFAAWWNSKEAEEFNFTADISLPAAAFERAGTGVMTRVVVLDKIPDTGERAMFGGNLGGTKRINFTGASTVKDFFDRLEGYDVPRRPQPKQDAISDLEAEAEDAETPVKPGAKVTPAVAADVKFKLSATKHGKTGVDLFVASIDGRVDREVYLGVLDVAKARGGYYSAFRGNGAVPGFQFKTEADRQAFLDDLKKPTVAGFEETDARFVANGEPFYSPLLRAVLNAKQAKATPKDWRAIIPKLAGVKKSEMDWIGIDEWLAVQESVGARQIDRTALADFIRKQQIAISIDVHGKVEPLTPDPYDYTPEWRDPTYEDAETLIDSDDDWESPDYRMSDGEPYYPDDWDDEAEVYLDEARQELEDEALEDWDEEENGEFDPAMIPDDAVLDRAKQMAEERYEPSQYEVTLYDSTGRWPEYSGTYDSDDRSYFFPELSQDNLDRTDAIHAADRVYEAAREKAISDKLQELLDGGLSAEGVTREEFDAEVAREQAAYQERLRAWREENAERIARNEARGFSGSATWGSYTEAGGDQYREILIRVPDLHATGANATGLVGSAARKAQIEAEMTALESEAGGMGLLQQNETLAPRWDALAKELEGMGDIVTDQGVKLPFVQRSHFAPENIVVHARVKDRTDSDGKRVLFVEEIQSDLATKWRDVKEDTPEVAQKRLELDAKAREAVTARGKAAREMASIILEKARHTLWGGASQHEDNAISMAREMSGLLMGKLNAVRASASTMKAFPILEGDMKAMGAAKRYDDADEDFKRAQEELAQLGTKRKADPTLPKSPWADPEQYVLMVKYLLREAAAKGYDKLSWTPGWMQARRWNKAAQSVVSGVSWVNDGEGGAAGEIKMMGGHTPISFEADPQGNITSKTDMINGSTLQRLLGKQLAQRVLSEPEGSADGLSVTFGDSGYAIAYDGHIKRAVEKLVKPLGGRVVEDRSLPDFAKSLRASTDFLRTLSIDDFLRRGEFAGALTEENKARIAQDRASGISESYIIGNALTWMAADQVRAMVPELSTPDAVWTAELTPEMRAAANVPQPMFQRKRARLVREAAAATEEITRLMPALRAELDRLDLKRVKLRQGDGKADWQGAITITGDGEIEIVIGASLDPLKTLHHEVIHALRAMNLFTAEEWKALTLAAERKWLDKHDIEARYPHLTREEQIEEAIAEEFSEALAAKQAPKGSILIRTFNKIARVFRALRNVLNGAGYQTPEDIFGRVLAGEISKRQAGNTGARVGMREQEKEVIFRNDLPGETVLETVQITGEIAQDQVKAKTRAALESLIGKKMQTADGTQVEVTGNSAGKLGVFPKGDWRSRALVSQNLERVLGASLIYGDAPDADGRGTLVWQYAVAHVLINGEPAVVRMSMRQVVSEGRTIAYDLQGFEIARLSVSNADGPVAEKANQPPSSRKMTVANALSAIKSGARIFQRKRDTATGDLFAQPEPAKPAGMTDAQRREIEARQKQSKMRRLGGNEGDAGPLFNDDRDLFGERTLFQRPPLAVRPLTPHGRAVQNSAMGANPFIPDRRMWETLTQSGVPIWQRLRDLPGAASDAVDRARQVIQDRFLPVLRAQEAVMRQTGRHVPREQDAYTAETTFSGKVGKHLLQIDEEYTKPIIQIIAASKGRMDADSVGSWLYARHAIERNAYIATINPMMPDGGSGMMDAEAQQILADVAASPDAAAYDQIGALIDALRERNLRLRVDAGLISTDEANLWRTQYKHYVPLKGFEETDNHASLMDLGGVRTGRRFSQRGPESRRALGRGSEAFNPLQSAITQAQEVSIRAEKNRVAQALYNLAESHPSKAMWEVKKPKQKRYFNRTTGLVETRVEDPVSMIMEPNEMAVKIDGEERRILFHDERLADAAGTLGADQMGNALRVLAVFSRFFSMTRTMLNPEFMVTNAFRDFQTAQFNIQAFGEGDKARIAAGMAKNWRKAFMGAMRGSSYRFDTEWSRYYDEFQKAGAQVWFWTMEQPEAARDDLEKRISLARGNRAQRAFKVMTSPSALFSFRDNAALEYVQRVNAAVDNAIRLAAFVEARKAGWPVEKAAFLAKELTVNFNRRGEAGPTMNALYPFFNAAIQGTVRTVKALSSRRVAGMVLTAFAAGVLLDLANASLSEEDDDGELFYDKVPNFRNERNLHFVLWGTGDNPLSVPMPYGYNVFPYAGQQLGKVIRGVKPADEAFADVVAAAFGAFSPISAATPAQLVSPFVSDPLVEMAENKNWLGIPVYPQDYGNQTEPDAYVHFSGVTAVSKWVAQSLNSMTGGDFRESGFVDVSPETLDHLATFVTGSAGAFFGRSLDVVSKSLQGDFASIEQRNIPFVRTLTSPVGEWQDRDRYYRFASEVKNAQADKKAYEGAGIPVPPKTAALASLYEDFLAAEREKNGKGEWNASKQGALASRTTGKIYLDFNSKYLRVMGKQAE